MTRDELLALEAQIAGKREEREKHNQVSVAAKTKAKALSVEIRALEAKLPHSAKANGIRMRVEPANVTLKTKR